MRPTGDAHDHQALLSPLHQAVLPLHTGKVLAEPLQSVLPVGVGGVGSNLISMKMCYVNT